MSRKHLIYLAAGSARRFGSKKLFYPLEGRPMYRWGLEMLAGVVKNRPECTLTVVSRYPEIRQTARQLGAAAVDSPQSEKGMAWSIRAGLAALGPLPKEDFLLFALADQPWLGAATVERLLTAAQPGTLAAAVSFAGRRGSPTLFSARFVPELAALEGDTGGREILRRLGPDCLLVEADSPKELEDLDLPPEHHV